MILAFILKYWQGILIAIAIGFVSWWHYSAVNEAYNKGVASEKARMLQKSVEILRERTKTNENIREMDDAGLCVALGGSMQPNGSCK